MGRTGCTATSACGDARFQGKKFLVNGKSLFQRMVLDQGFYPDGIYTAPTEEDLIQDIQLSFAAGFNGARLHEKVFEARFLYHCDRLGYLVWGEYPNWGLDHTHPLSTETYLNQWSEAVERDFNHPAIIGWCPFNETWGYREEREKRFAQQHLQADQAPGPHPPLHRFQRQLPGDFRRSTTSTTTTRTPRAFLARYNGLSQRMEETGGAIPAEDPFFNSVPEAPNGRPPFFNQPYEGQPVFISEYGGIRWPR